VRACARARARIKCALVLPMKNAITYYKRDFQRTEYNMKNIKIK